MDPFLIFFTVRNETIKLLAENMDEFVHNLDEEMQVHRWRRSVSCRPDLVLSIDLILDSIPNYKEH